MAKLLTIAKVVALIAISFFFVEAGLFFKNGIISLDNTLVSINTATDSISKDSIKLGQTLDMINNPDPRLGTIKLVNKDLVNLKDTLVLINMSAKTFSDTSRTQALYAQKWDGQITDTLGNVNKIAVTANQSISDTSLALQSSVVAIKPVLQQTTSTLVATEKLISNPEVVETIHNLNTSSKALSGITTDTETWWHNTLYPKWPRRVMNVLTNQSMTAIKWFTGN